MTEESKKVQEDEIDLVEFAKMIWSNRKFIAKVTGFFVAIGLFIAIFGSVEYEASCKLLPESQEGANSNLGGLSSLAGLAGINLGGAQKGSLSPELYPEIVYSLPFIIDVMNDTIYFENIDEKTTSFNYFQNLAKPSFL